MEKVPELIKQAISKFLYVPKTVTSTIYDTPGTYETPDGAIDISITVINKATANLDINGIGNAYIVNGDVFSYSASSPINPISFTIDTGDVLLVESIK